MINIEDRARRAIDTFGNKKMGKQNTTIYPLSQLNTHTSLQFPLSHINKPHNSFHKPVYYVRNLIQQLNKCTGMKKAHIYPTIQYK